MSILSPRSSPSPPRSIHSGLAPVLIVLWFLGLAALIAWLYLATAFETYVAHGVVGPSNALALFGPLVTEWMALALVIIWLPWRRPLTWALAAGVLAVFLLVQLAQYVAVERSGEFIVPEILRLWDHVTYIMAWDVVALLVGSVGVWVGSLWLARRTTAGGSTSPIGRLPASALALLAILVLQPGADTTLRQLEASHGIVLGAPCVAMFNAVIQVQGETLQESEVPLDLSPAAIAVAAEHGIVIDPTRYAPLAKHFIYQDPLPFEATGREGPPNVVVLFIESLSAAVLPAYGAPYPGLTPNLDLFAAESMRVDNYLNHTTPTVNGLRGQLCSVFPRIQYQDWADAEAKLTTGRLSCLPQILAGRGYDTIHLSHAPAEETFLQTQLISLGYGETYFKETILKRFLDDVEPLGRSRQPDDAQMFDSLVSALKERETRREPFFMTLSTVGTHSGLDVVSMKNRYRQHPNRVLNTVHEMDRGFGHFWEWFRASPLADNTIVVLTGDHTMLPNNALRKVAGDRSRDHVFDYMGLIIRDPFHRLPPALSVASSSIDFAPSLAQLMDVPNQPNSFMGRSLFSDRQRFAGGPGLIYQRRLLSWTGREPSNHYLYHCDQARAKGLPPARDCLLLEAIFYSQALESANRFWLD